MFPLPLRDTVTSRVAPAVTWSLLCLNVFIFLWDRGFTVAGRPILFSDLAMRPAEITLVLMRQGNATELGKIFTSLFLHGDLMHLVMNMITLQAFGPTVERILGGWRFALFYLFWGIVATLAHTFVYPHSNAYLLGASGAIGGIMGMYFLIYPANKIEMIVFPFFWWPFPVPAGIVLGVWIALQFLFPQAGVANWAHIGGFAAGMLTVLVHGGRDKALVAFTGSSRPLEEAKI
jgi:membrane associated rhomboid family serine protease